jgi:NADPH2:quinone reductase
MRAISYSRTGDPAVLTLIERPEPTPGPGEVAVRIHRSGINPTDWKARQGGVDPVVVDPPQVPGQDGAGVVVAVGQGVEASLVGLRVWVWEAAYRRTEGTAQEVALVPARQVVLLPDSASFDLGASLGIPFLTAHRCLTAGEALPDRLGPGALSGRTILVTGGAGAVGNAAIQLARWSDATIISTISSARKAQLAAAAGADHVINYCQEDVVAEVHKIVRHGVDAIVEVAPAVNAAADSALIARFGSIVAYASDAEQEVSFPARALMTKNAAWHFVLVYTVAHDAKVRALEDVDAAVLDGAIRLGEHAGLPLHHYPLADAVAAYTAVQNGAVGKVLIDVID